IKISDCVSNKKTKKSSNNRGLFQVEHIENKTNAPGRIRTVPKYTDIKAFTAHQKVRMHQKCTKIPRRVIHKKIPPR
ncbi:hypothetical protein, partial [Lactiplantibacillus pentosus]